MSDIRLPGIRLIVVDPGHFHAALVQKEMYPALSPRVQVYAPLGPDLVDYLTRIARFNQRANEPTGWEIELHASPDFLDRMRGETPGSVAIFSGRNGGKIERIRAAVEAGFHVLADKPAIIRREDLALLEASLDAAEARRLIVADMMTGRSNTLARLLCALRADPELFGEPVAGTADEPGVVLSGMHYLSKIVAGVPNPRPAWYFDVTQQGEGLADTAVHLVDRVQTTLFPDAALDYRSDIDIVAASRWPTVVTSAQFRLLTGEDRWPDFLAPWLRGDALDYFCNGRVDYRVRGISVRLEVRWDWQAEQGDDTHQALYRGTRCRLEIRQGPTEGYRPELYVVPPDGMPPDGVRVGETGGALERRIAALQPAFPRISVERVGREWRIVVPDVLRIAHDPAFAAFTRGFLDHVANPASLPAWHRANLLAKYYVTTEAVALSHG
jgi:predicted dehydrogenase